MTCLQDIRSILLVCKDGGAGLGADRGVEREPCACRPIEVPWKLEARNMAVNGKNMSYKAVAHCKFRMSDTGARQLVWSRIQSPLMWVRWYDCNAARVKVVSCTHS